jgi:hypothetical protein
MEDEQDGEHVGCEGGIKNELHDYLARYVIAHDELPDELESHEQNDPEKVKLRKDYVAEGCAAISEYDDCATGDWVTYAKTLNRAKTQDRGHNAKSGIEAKGAQRVKEPVLQR